MWRDFVILLVSCLSLGLTMGFRFREGILSRVVSLSVTVVWVGLGRCRLWMYFGFGRCFRSVSIHWMCYCCWGVQLTEGESYFIVFHRVDGWKLEISRAEYFSFRQINGEGQLDYHIFIG